jgi:Flp pilus assembly protein TadD
MSIRKVVSIDQAEWTVAPAPEWADHREPDWEFTAADGHPVSYLLIDVQHHVATQACTTRTVRRLSTLAAVQSFSHVELDFDPAAFRLRIHELAVWRAAADGRWERRSLARREAFMLRQREQQLEQQMLTGRLSVVALLEDVRVGDAIDVAWTLEPRDRLPGLRFAEFFAFAWPVPIARAWFTLHLSSEHPVKWRMHAPEGLVLPAESVAPGTATWSVDHPPVLVPEQNVPGGHWPFALLDVSGWTTWNEVAQFMATLWEDALSEGAGDVAAEASRLRSSADAVRGAIRFVQEEIRFLAVDFGHGGGILPNGAGTVLRRRFGDCKDKAVLLTAMLRALGIEAWPMLVGANWREGVARVQPSTATFSHAIVSFLVDGRRYFVDPTAVGQGGDLAHLISPPFGVGLEVRPDADALLTLPALPAAELSLTETFELDRKQREGAVVQKLRASAWLADEVRSALVREGRAAFSKARAEALQKHFPALAQIENAVVVDDDPVGNVIEFRARYALPTWGPTGEAPPAVFRYGAHGLLLAVEIVDASEQRKQPWALRYPMKVAHRVVVRGRCVGKTRPERHEVLATAFRCSTVVSARRHEVAFDYAWETMQREVGAGEWAEYCRERDAAFAHAGANVATGAKIHGGWNAFWLVIPVLAILSNLSKLTSKDASPPRGAPSTTRVAERLQNERDLNSAMQAASRGEYVRSQILIERIRANYEGDLRFQKLRGEVALRTGNLDQAREAIASARKLDPTGDVPDLMQAILHENLGDLVAARSVLENLVARTPNDVRVLYLLARVLERMGDPAAAESAWQRFLALQPRHPDGLFQYALLLWKRGERARADEILVETIQLLPAPSAPLESALSQYYAATERQTQAVAPAQRAAELAPDDPVIAHRHVMALARAGDRAGAVASARSMVGRFPKHPEAWSALALSLAMAGEIREAEDSFATWRELAPGDPDSYANYGYFLFSTGRLADARVFLEEAARDFPGYGPIWMNYAVVLDSLGEKQVAAEARRKANALMTGVQSAGLVR